MTMKRFIRRDFSFPYSETLRPEPDKEEENKFTPQEVQELAPKADEDPTNEV